MSTLTARSSGTRNGAFDTIFGRYFDLHIDKRAIWPNDHVAARYTHVFFAVHALFVPYTVCLTNRMVGVGQQGERQAEFLFELKVALNFL